MMGAILFEQSGLVRDAFLAQGLDCISIDLEPTKRPGPHIQGDVFDHLNDGYAWAIMHPTCQYMAGSGLHWNDRVPGRNLMTAFWLNRVRMLMDCPIPIWAIENPVGAIGTQIMPSHQTIQPYQFGDDASKRTQLWLRGLPKLRPTGWRAGRIVEPDPQDLFGGGVERWENQTDDGQNRLGETKDRWMKRSETYPGVARAMALQWGEYLKGLQGWTKH